VYKDRYSRLKTPAATRSATQSDIRFSVKSLRQVSHNHNKTTITVVFIIKNTIDLDLSDEIDPVR